MQSAELDYELPEELIAQQPPAGRDQGRLLVLPGAERGQGAALEHRRITDLTSLIPSGALLVLNDTQVMKARVLAKRAQTEGRVELLFLNPSLEDARCWEVMVKANRPLPVGAELTVGQARLQLGERTEQGTRWVRCAVSVEELLGEHGLVPLPPYVRRAARAEDEQSYQTVFARAWGSAAAPTAGLHLTAAMLSELQARGVQLGTLTLHVGAGTFRPVATATLAEHRMHSERFVVSETLQHQVAAAKQRGAPVVAVGTTVVRALESAARAAANAPAEPVRAGGAAGEHIAIATATSQAHLAPPLATGEQHTELLISPGYEFRIVDALLTNFHAPRSTLLALVYAFAGTELIRRAYAEAIAQRYRFLSYGDAMWIPARSN